MLRSPEKIEFRKISRTLAIYNMIPSMFWTALFLIPLTIFCYTYVTSKTTCLLLGLSFTPIFLPNSFFDRIQLSTNAHFYKKIGVKYINTVVQNGSLIKKLLRRKYPKFKVISKSKKSIQKQYYQTYLFEKFHFSLFLFFTSITTLAVIQGHYYWALTLTISNLLYNIYPNLLQQYIRVKLKSAVINYKQS